MADLQMYADHFLKEFINEAVLGVAYEAHRSFTKGTLFLDETNSDEEENKYKIVVANGLDIFGQPIGGSKKNVECICPNCNRNMAASRFAPHLEKCMGMGRNSSRIASQRIANSGKLASAANDGLGDDDVDDANDADWFASESTSTRKAKKRKADRNNGLPRGAKSVPSKTKNSPKNTSVSSTSHQSSVTASTNQYAIDLNANVRNINYANRNTTSALNENINHTVSLWEKHINATLSGQTTADTVVSSTAKVATSSTGMVKKSKKSSKHSQNKKNKKRQVTQQSGTVV